MKITYTGKRTEFTPQQQKKLDARFAKVNKLLDRRGGSEKEAHIILAAERHLTRAEITVHFYDHPLVGINSDTDPFLAVAAAAEKLEKQLLKLRAKWRDTKRVPDAKIALATAKPAKSTGGSRKSRKSDAAASKSPIRAGAAAPPSEAAASQIFRVNHNGRKPMTVEEALLEFEHGRDYVVYHDAATDRVSVLVKRRDGNFDLIEA